MAYDVIFNELDFPFSNGFPSTKDSLPNAPIPPSNSSQPVLTIDPIPPSNSPQLMSNSPQNVSNSSQPVSNSSQSFTNNSLSQSYNPCQSRPNTQIHPVPFQSPLSHSYNPCQSLLILLHFSLLYHNLSATTSFQIHVHLPAVICLLKQPVLSLCVSVPAPFQMVL